MLSGLGVPDLSGRIGKPAYYTSDPFFALREGNDFSVEVVRLESNVGQAGHADRGPAGPGVRKRGHDRPAADARRCRDARDRLIVEAGGARAELQPGQWSDWLSLDFRVNPLVTVHGYARLRLASIAAGDRPLPVADPVRSGPPAAGLRDLLAARLRRGARRAVRPLQDDGLGASTRGRSSRRRFREEAFLEDVRADGRAGAQDARRACSRAGEKLLFHYFEFPDRVAHVFWRLRDPQHPAYDAALAAQVRRRRREVLRDDGRRSSARRRRR